MQFGVFEARLDSGELFKNGRRVRLQQQPYEALLLLLEHHGEVVTRDQLRRRLWPDDVTVEFEQSLNKCMTRLRDALGDEAANPRFIETLPKRGYRFIAPLRAVAPAAVAMPAAPTVALPAARQTRAPAIALAAAAALALAIVAAAAALDGATGVDAGDARATAATEATPSPAPATRSPIFAAQDAFDRGRAALARRSPDSLRLAVEHFTRAIALSPRFADAYVGLADGWSLLASYGRVDPRDAMPRAREAANRALTLDPSLARAHASLARTAMIYDWDCRTAEWHFQRALTLQPGDSPAHQWRAYLFSAMGRHDEAIADARRAIAGDPLSLNANTALGFVLYLARRFDEAAIQLERTIEIDPDFAQARRNLALVHLQQGRMDEAVAGLERVVQLRPDSAAARGELAWAYGRAGQRARAHTVSSELDRMRTSAYVPPDALALAALGRGAHDEAVAWLQRAATLRLAALAHLRVDPFWDELGDDPRVQALAAGVGC